MEGDWSLSGPLLPIEFSRIASDGRLSLIVDREHGASCKTWICDSPLALGDAVANLTSREGCNPRWIGWVDRSGRELSQNGPDFVTAEVLDWCVREGYAGAMWTALPSTFEARAGNSFSVPAAIAYLDSLTGETRERAFEYIRRAPRSTVTPVRTAFDERWPGSA